MLCLFIAGSFAYAQQDPNDPGYPDYVFFQAHSMSHLDTLCLPPDPGLWPWDVEIGIYLWSDNPINGLAIPLVDTSYGSPVNSFLDPLKNLTDSAFKDGIVAEFDSLISDLTNNPPQVVYAASDTNDSVAFSWGYLITRMIFTVSGEGRISLDSLTLPNGEKLQLRRTDGIWYTPQFDAPTGSFIVAACMSAPPEITCPSTILAFEVDTIIYEVEAVDPRGYNLIEESACIQSLDSAHYSLIPLGNITSSGTWRVEIYTDSLIFGKYYLDFCVQDEWGAEGCGITEMYYTQIGDADCDYDIDLSDVIFTANFLLKGGEAPEFFQLADVNCNGGISLDDVIYLANHLLKGGPEPCEEP